MFTTSRQIFSFPDYAAERRQIELTANSKSHVSYGQNGGRDAVKKYTFDFDLVFDSSCSQEDMFLEVSALVQSALDGFNVCIFAYGQTGYVCRAEAFEPLRFDSLADGCLLRC